MGNTNQGIFPDPSAQGAGFPSYLPHDQVWLAAPLRGTAGAGGVDPKPDGTACRVFGF